MTASRGDAGGLVGRNEGALSSIYATGAVQGSEHHVGGLVGYNSAAISNSYASGAVTGVGGSSYIGGLVGRNYGSVSNSYATGDVQGFNYVGGLLGGNYGGVSTTYATGLVQSSNNAGGLIGSNYGSVVNSFWNTETSGQTSSYGGAGLTSNQMMQLSSFSSWNVATPNTIASTGGSGASWRIYEGHTAPLLTQFLTALTLTDATVVTYNGTAQGSASVVPSGVLIATATNAGSYSAFYSGQQGYDITGGTLTINKANLTLSGTRSYDGSTVFAGSALMAIGVAGESFIVTGAGDASNLASKNTQTGSTLASLTGLALGASGNGGLPDNYNALSTTASSVSITRANLVLGSGNVTKTYDGTFAANGVATVTGGALFGSDSLSGGTFAFTNANAGVGNKTVTSSGVTVVDGNSGGNYNVTYASNTTSTINPASLMLSTSNITKIYDGSLAASGVLTIASGTLFGSDSLSGGNFAFTNKNVGAGNKTVTTSAVTVNDGNDGANYSVGYVDNITSTITAATLAVTGVTANNKVYDGTTAATLAGAATVMPIGADDVAVSGAGSGVFASADVGIAKAITVSGFALSGSDAGNYIVAQPAGLTADITDIVVIPENPPIAATPIAELKSVTGQIQSSIFFPAANAQSPPSLSPELVENQLDSDTPAPGAVPNVGTSGGPAKPLLRIVDGGMKLPGNSVQENDD